MTFLKTLIGKKYELELPRIGNGLSWSQNADFILEALRYLNSPR